MASFNVLRWVQLYLQRQGCHCTCRPESVRITSPFSLERPFCCKISLKTSAVRYERSISTCKVDIINNGDKQPDDIE